jgi:hypothetical protein
MQKVGAYVAISVLIVVVSSPSPSAAFGLRLGPFHLGLPSFGHRHRPAQHPDVPAGAAIYNRTESTEAAGKEPAHGPSSPLLYPGLALPAVYGDIFAPASAAPWPFGYDAIFRAAFAKASVDQDQHPCQPTDRGTAVVERIGREIRPTVAQRPLLQKLGRALGMASGFLAQSCPKEIPSQPVARLQLMQTQIEVLTMALDIIREPLQDFEQSLTPNQQARFAAAAAASGAAAGRNAAENKNEAENVASACGATPTNVDWSLDQLNQSLQPNDRQRDAMVDVKDAFGRAAGDLAAQCPTSLPPTPLARLESAQARLDAEWRAVLTIQVALGNLENRLSDDQRGRFNAMDFAAAH